MELKEQEVESKKDQVKDLHPTMKRMLKMASVIKPDKIRELCKEFKSFFNSKNRGTADIEVHQLMEHKGFGDEIFGEGPSLTRWSGNSIRANPTAPSTSPLSHSKRSNYWEQAKD
jgi:hypothetical protein